jgi:NAD(P)-dependent dehydrogenase (short-subunit alcohol dehydrogenase family)
MAESLLDRHVAVVTGAGHGFGRHTARSLSHACGAVVEANKGLHI